MKSYTVETYLIEKGPVNSSRMKGGRTLHLKGRFSKINEPEVPLARGRSGPVWALFFTY